MTDYRQEAADDAAETVRNFAEEILEQLLDKGEASNDLLNDYPDGDEWHHTNHVDAWYNSHDAAAILTQLEKFEESDRGLWEGLPLKEAFSACAAYTYSNAVMAEWFDLIGQINDEAEGIIDEYDSQIADLEAEGGDPAGLRAYKKAALEALIKKAAGSE